jgi:hypothetical protein
MYYCCGIPPSIVSSNSFFHFPTPPPSSPHPK